MALSEHASGTRTAGTPPEGSFTVIGTTTDTTTGVFQLFVDVTNLARGDTLVIQMREKVKSGGTQGIAWQATLVNAQDYPVWISPSFILINGWDFALKQTTGTARSFDWSIRKVA